ncbi:MAG: Gfo/Idh/MocA family oxidoreductase [Kiritimatiellia bacterium]|nr:Gfo/Idh/MocA family oxidoreductase [Kiritimatiellia bacterium]
MSSEIKIGIIGMDSSHTPEFVRLIQGEEKKMEGFRVARAMRFPSPFQAEKGQDERQAKLEGWGVKTCATVAETVEGMDAVFVEINDPAQHLKYFEEVAGLGIPVFLDKPLAGSLAEGKKIVELATRHKTNVWSASSLRFIPGLAAARAKVPEPVCANIYGALGKAAAGSDLIWYGVHAVEMLNAVMGMGARSVRALSDDNGVVLSVQYGGGRRAVVECNANLWQYGGRLQKKDAFAVFDSVGELFYVYLLKEIRQWLAGGPAPVSMADALEILAILDAGEQSSAQGGAAVSIDL